ncbi:MAG: DUF2157 domain-containing protein [Candidatus Pacearchaeota archaeon]|jgi:uncharacterized membrane protein
MVDENQIKKWVDDGTITSAQAKKMLKDSSKEEVEEKSNNFFAIIAIIGAVLIFIGFAWLIAYNWNDIPDPLKVFILLGATLSSFVIGVLARQNNHEGVGRSLVTLGALLFILSLFLISQIYNLPTTMQHYSNILLVSWIFIILTAYLLDSKENLLVSLLTFFPWFVFQYYSTISKYNFSSQDGVIFGYILLFISAGALLYGLSVLHSSLKHRFTNIYRFWTVFYFLLIFYILSFQSILPILSDFSLVPSTMTLFLVSFIILCFLGFVTGTLFGVSKEHLSIKEILIFLGILVVLFFLILSTKAGAGLIGSCYPQNCYNYDNAEDCNSAPDPLVCKWDTSEYGMNRARNNAEGYCNYLSCENYYNESACNNAPAKLNCIWDNKYCRKNSNIENIYDKCNKYDNKKSECVNEKACNWRTSSYLGRNQIIPTIFWFLWILNNFIFIGFIILMIWYGQKVGSTNIINLSLSVFILEIISRYIGFWMDFEGYLAFSLLAILGGLLLIFGAWIIPKWRRQLIEKINPEENKSDKYL